MRNYFARGNISRDDLLSDKDFLNDAAAFMKGRTGKEYEDKKDLYEAFVEHMRIATVNEITAVRDLNYIKKADEAAKDQAGRLYIAFDRLKKGTSVWETIKDYGEGLARAPSTYISLTGVGILGKGAAFGTTKGITETAKLMATASIKKAATKAAIRGGAIEGGIGGIQGGAYSAARKATGREEFVDTNLLTGAITGGVIGAIPGVAFGGAAGAKALKQDRIKWKDLAEGEANKNLRIKTGNEATDKLLETNFKAKAVQKALGNRFKPKAKPPLPEKMTKIGRELREVTDEYRITMKPEVLKNLEGATIELLLRLGVTTKDIETKRITQLIGEAIRDRVAKSDDLKLGTGTLDMITEIQKKYGLNDQQFGYMLVSEMSDAGRTLVVGKNVQQAVKAKIKHNMDELAGEAKLLDKAGLGDEQLTKILETYNPANAQHVRDWFMNLDKARLGYMTLQTATTMRNAIGGGLRTVFYLLDNMFQGGLETITTRDKATRARAFSRMGSGFRALRNLTWNQSEGNALRLLFQEEMPLQFRQLFRQNADIAAAMGTGSGMAKWSRKFNILNTYTDNAFKRAIFLAELQTQLGGRANLRTLIRTGNFADLAKPEYKGRLEEAIKEANSVVYQRNYKETIFRPKKVIDQAKKSKIPFLTKKMDTGELEAIERSENASTILKICSSPLTTWALPFPKFVMNSIEFMYTHAPVLGLTVGLGKTPWQKALAKNMTGSAILYGAVQLRAAQGPEARWWEVYDKDTKKHTSAMALYGPFAPYMLAADLILRSNIKEEEGKFIFDSPIVAGTDEYKAATHENWARVIKDPLTVSMFQDGMYQEYAKAVFGTTFRTGVGLDFIKGLTDDIQEARFEEREEGEVTHLTPGVQKAIAKFAGNWANTFMVAGGEIRDMYSMIDPQYEKIHDSRATTNSFSLFMMTSLRSLPVSDEGKYFGLVQGPEGVELLATSPTQQDELRRLGRDVTQFTGLGATEIRNDVDRELVRLNLPRYKMYKRYKQPDVNRRANALYQEYTQKIILPYLKSDEYTSMPNTEAGAQQQRVYLRQLFSQMRSHITDMLLDRTSRAYNRADTTSENFEKIQNEILFLLKVKFSRKSDDIKKFAVDAFKSTYGRAPTSSGEQGIQDQLRLNQITQAM